LLFAHTGITLGAGVLIASLTARYFARRAARPQKCSLASRDSDRQESNSPIPRESLLNHVDLRFLFVGSLLPDIIDKPIGHFFFRETFSNGRIFSHSLFFLVIISLIGYYVYKRYTKTWLLAISFGIFMHLILDQMWFNLHTLLWPILGFVFEKGDITDWLPSLILSLQTDPLVYVPELIGLLILVWFTVSLVHRRRFLDFLRFGRVR